MWRERTVQVTKKELFIVALERMARGNNVPEGVWSTFEVKFKLMPGGIVLAGESCSIETVFPGTGPAVKVDLKHECELTAEVRHGTTGELLGWFCWESNYGGCHKWKDNPDYKRI